jgi:hypothetical protein
MSCSLREQQTVLDHEAPLPTWPRAGKMWFALQWLHDVLERFLHGQLYADFERDRHRSNRTTIGVGPPTGQAPEMRPMATWGPTTPLTRTGC